MPHKPPVRFHMKPTFLCDVDGIAANFVEMAVHVMNRVSGQSIELEHVNCWDVTQLLLEQEHKEESKKEFLRQGFCSSFNEYLGTKEAIHKLNEMTNLYFVTSPMMENPYWMAERAEWLMSRYGVESRQVNFVTDKFITRGDFLLDDSGRNCALWKERNPFGISMIWDRPHNRNEHHPSVVRVYSWDEVINIVSRSTQRDDPY